MNYKIVNGSVSYGAETILEEINFEIKEKDKIAIVGRNGCGKSTLLNAIIDNSMFEEGIEEEKFNIYIQGSPTIGFLKQMDFQDSSKTLLEEILKVYAPILNLENKITKLANDMQNNSNQKNIKEYTEAFAEQLKELLSPLENHVLYLHLMGTDYRTIAELLGKSPKSVDNALQRIKTKAQKILP